MALTDANPAFGPTELGIMVEMSDLLIDSERFGSIPTHLKKMNLELQTSKFEKSELRELKFQDFEGSKNGLESSKSDS